MEGDEAERIRLRRRQRASLTEAERRLCYRLRDQSPAGFKFVGHEDIGPYVADFCCHEERLIVEADGGQPAKSEHDHTRLPPRFADDWVGQTLSPQAGRGGEHR